MEEIWRDIKGYEGLYQVSNTGKVKSLNYRRTGKERILKTRKDRYGYLLVNLYKDAKMGTYTVHRLVANAFLDNPENLPEVNHIDQDKTNNIASNLEYCSSSYNCNYGTRNQRMGESKKKPVYSIDKESGLFTYWESAKEAGEVLGINPSSIARCCKGSKYYNSAGGFYWHYASESEEVCDEKK